MNKVKELNSEISALRLYLRRLNEEIRVAEAYDTMIHLRKGMGASSLTQYAWYKEPMLTEEKLTQLREEQQELKVYLNKLESQVKDEYEDYITDTQRIDGVTKEQAKYLWAKGVCFDTDTEYNTDDVKEFVRLQRLFLDMPKKG